jgi:hypothetical protein
VTGPLNYLSLKKLTGEQNIDERNQGKHQRQAVVPGREYQGTYQALFGQLDPTRLAL